ncbi:mitochondrial import inner membrane translocase subunit tim17 [Fonsecaea monophora]|uniref:Mitochondrial import inner membrane translocase subunit tim17 n=1 Tax=Fonsecaea monophora TaxID=254056 RepID=A0A177EZX9_9EURO|nr:mitochondrial import inner membrane translocase subunit tim17 [Fonsecaea monophora]OAG37605.1 mitochondrial import inner membrane translocase subunit tim17 [Fonsecaea monophora]
MDHSRDPCPWVALSDFGGAFCMGALGGTLWHGIKGFRNSPYGERRIGMITAIKARAPVTGGNFGVWGGMFSTFDCAVKGIRQKEDPYNSIIAGFLTGGSLAIRGGYKAARNGAIMCAIFLAVIEGVGIGVQRFMAESTRLDNQGVSQHDWKWLQCHISFETTIPDHSCSWNFYGIGALSRSLQDSLLYPKIISTSLYSNVGRKAFATGIAGEWT